MTSIATVAKPTTAVAETTKQEITSIEPFTKGGKGRNTSGRNWKQQPKKRFSSLINTKKNNLTKSWARHQAEKEQRRKVLEREKEIKEEGRKFAIEKKERRLENERRRAENEFKHASSSAQTLNFDTAGHKMKAMNKKQLRMIKKTRMNTKTGIVEYVPAYAK